MWHGFQIFRWHFLVLGLSFFCGFVRGVFLRNSVESSAKYISSQFKNNGSAFGFTKWRSVSLVVRQLTSVVCLAPAKTRWGWTSFHSAAATSVMQHKDSNSREIRSLINLSQKILQNWQCV